MIYEENEAKLWQLLKEHWPRILLFLALWLILGLGIYKLLVVLTFFIPDSVILGLHQFISEEPSSDINIARFSISSCISFGVSCGLNALFFHLYFKQKKDLELLKDALRVLAYKEHTQKPFDVEEMQDQFGILLKENKDTVLQAIKKVVNDNGYDFSYKGCESRAYEETLYLTVQSREEDNRPLLNFIVTLGLRPFRITFDGVDCKDLNQLIIIIKDWLLNRKD